jgi:AbrB family transcriptional regulator (stage V sporulation protein T)
LILRAFSGVEKFFSFYLTRSDDLGRVVVPKEIRRTLRLREGTPLEIFTDREGEIIFKKYSPMAEMGTFAKQYADALAQTTGMVVYITDRDQILAVAGTRKEGLQKPISRQLEQRILNRESGEAGREDRKFVLPYEEDKETYAAETVHIILCEGDAIGAVILCSRDAKMKIGDAEKKLAATAANFLGRQLES